MNMGLGEYRDIQVQPAEINAQRRWSRMHAQIVKDIHTVLARWPQKTSREPE